MDELRQLIAENEDWLIELILSYAKKHGYTKIIEADNGKTALTYIHNMKLESEKEQEALIDNLLKEVKDPEIKAMWVVCAKCNKPIKDE